MRNVPDPLHRQLKAKAALAGLPFSDYPIREVRKLAAHPTPKEMRERLRGREGYTGRNTTAELVRAKRGVR